MKTKKELLKEMGWSDKLIESMFNTLPIKKIGTSDKFNKIIPKCYDSSNIIISMDKPNILSGKYPETYMNSKNLSSQ